MHFSVLVAAADVESALAPFRVGEVPPYPRACLCRQRGGRDFGRAPNESCRVCKGTGIWMNDVNPAGRWDSFVVTQTGLRREAVLANGVEPYATIVGGRFHQSDDGWWFPEVADLTDRIVFVPEGWPDHLQRLLRELPAEALLTLVDCHG